MHIVIFITTANKEESKKIAVALLEAKLAACVNIVDKVRSMFWWKGRIDSSEENLLIVKTAKSKLVKVIKTVKSLHSYTVPEVIALPVSGGNKDYLSWIDESVR